MGEEAREVLEARSWRPIGYFNNLVFILRE